MTASFKISLLPQQFLIVFLTSTAISAIMWHVHAEKLSCEKAQEKPRERFGNPVLWQFTISK